MNPKQSYGIHFSIEKDEKIKFMNRKECQTIIADLVKNAAFVPL